MRRTKLFFLIISFFSAWAANAEPVVTTTTPVEGDPFRDVRIKGCSNTRALALMQYDSLAGPFVVSDFCINEDTGEVLGPETITGFELVSSSRAGKKFDIPATRNRQYQPTKFTLGRNDPRDSCGLEEMRFFDYTLSKEPLAQYPEFDFAYATGFTYNEVGQAPLNFTGVEALLAFTNFNQYGIEGISARRVTGLPTGLSIYGDFVATGQEGAITVIEGDGYASGDASGELAATVDASGEVHLTGSFEARSLDDNGHDLAKWISIKGEVAYFRGYVFGEPAKFIQGFGLISGTFETFDGQVVPFRSDVHLWTCSE